MMSPVVLQFSTSYVRNARIASVVVALFFCGTAATFWLVDPPECPENPPAKDPFVAKAVLSLVWVTGGLALASLLMIDAREVRWHEIEVDRGELRFKRNGAEQVIRDADLGRAHWRCRPVGGAAVLATSTDRFVIRFDQIPREERSVAIRALRELVGDVEDGWPEFCRQIALPLARGIRSEVDARLRKDGLLYTRRHWDVFCGVTATLCLGVGTLGAWMTNSPRFLLAPLVVVLFWPLRFAWPKEGLRMERKQSSPGEQQSMLGLGAGIIGLMISFPVLTLMHIPKPLDSIVLVAISLLAVSPAPLIAFAFRKARRDWHENERRSAVAEWDAPTEDIA